MPGAHSLRWPTWKRTRAEKAAGKNNIVISPIAMEIVRRINALFEIERTINVKSPEERKAVRQVRSAPLVADLHVYMEAKRARLSRATI